MVVLEYRTATVDIGGGQCVHAVKTQACMESFGAPPNFQLINQESALLECVLDPRINDRIDP